MGLSACVACKLPVLELEGQFEKLDSFFITDGSPPKDSAGWWHMSCLRASAVGPAWQAARLRNYRDVRKYEVAAELPDWIVIRDPRRAKALAIGTSGELVDLTIGRRPVLRETEGGVVFARVEEEFHLEIEDTTTIAKMQRTLEQASVYPISELLLALGIADHVVDAVALEGATFRFEHGLRSFWQKRAVSARLEYGVFVPGVLDPYARPSTKSRRAPASSSASPGAVFALAHLPARRLAHDARRDLVAHYASTTDPRLKHAIEFSRRALDVERAKVGEAEKRLASLARAVALAVAPMPAADPLADWFTALSDAMRPHLTSPVLEAAWKAGEIGRRVAVSAELIAHIAYLRCAAPEHAELKARADECARELEANAVVLTTQLQATGLPLVISHADSVEAFVGFVFNRMSTTAEGYRQLNELVAKIYSTLDITIRHLDTPPPAKPTSPQTADEDKLFAKIVAEPRDYQVRREFATLAAKRNDPRAQLIELQMAPAGPAEAQKAYDLVRSHPDWTSRLENLGARDIKFAGGFPEEITIDADVLLARWDALRAAAPLTRLHIRGPKGHAHQIVRSSNLATIEALDLDGHEVTDDDVEALAANPHAARLRQLDLRFNVLTKRGVEAIAASPILERLEVVNLEPNQVDPVDRQEYYDETHYHFVPTEAGQALEAKYGRLRWLHRR